MELLFGIFSAHNMIARGSENIFDKTFCIYVTTAHKFRIIGSRHIYIRFAFNLNFQFVITKTHFKLKYFQNNNPKNATRLLGLSFA